MSKSRSSYCFNNHIGHFLSVLTIEPRMIFIVWAHSPLSIWRVSFWWCSFLTTSLVGYHFNIRFVSWLQELATPHTLWLLDKIGHYLIRLAITTRNLKVPSFEIKVRCKVKIMFLLNDQIDLPNRVHILTTYSTLILTWNFLVSIYDN